MLVVDDVFRPLDALPRLQAQRNHGSLRLPLRRLLHDRSRCSGRPLLSAHLAKKRMMIDFPPLGGALGRPRGGGCGRIRAYQAAAALLLHTAILLWRLDFFIYPAAHLRLRTQELNSRPLIYLARQSTCMLTRSDFQNSEVDVSTMHTVDLQLDVRLRASMPWQGWRDGRGGGFLGSVLPTLSQINSQTSRWWLGRRIHPFPLSRERACALWRY